MRASPRPHAATGARRGRTPPPPLPPGTPTAPLWGRLAYDGTDYAGWQSQTARGGDSMARRPRTVQGEVEAALETVLRAPAVSLSLAAAGRTDAGVHAQGQVISLRAPLGVDASVARVNAVLPPDVRFTHLARAPPDFHARYSPIAKAYEYRVDVGAVADPLMRRFAAHAPRARAASLAAAAPLFLGAHDFTHFASINATHPAPDPVRTVLSIGVEEDPRAPHLITLRIVATGFLYRMARHVVGALLAVGEGRLSAGEVEARLAAGAAAPPGAAFRGWAAAPAHGLTLASVILPHGMDEAGALLHPDVPHDARGRVDGAAVAASRAGRPPDAVRVTKAARAAAAGLLLF